jgi:hypothetical protein
MKWILWEWRHLVWNCRPYCGLEIDTFPLKRMLEHHIYLWIPPKLLRTPTVYTWFLLWLRFFRAFSSVVRQMPWYTSQRRGTVRTLPNSWNVLFYVLFVSIVLSMYCLCVNEYCTTATGCQPNCSQQIYHITSSSLNLARAKESLLTIKSHFY